MLVLLHQQSFNKVSLLGIIHGNFFKTPYCNLAGFKMYYQIAAADFGRIYVYYS